jgi:hypothetical protein
MRHFLARTIVTIGWTDFVKRLKPPLSQKGIIQAMAQCVQAAVNAEEAVPLRKALNQNSLGTDWLIDLGKTLERTARELAAESSRAGQARLCRVQLLNRIMTNVSYEAVLELEPELRSRWLAFNSKETPFDLDKQMSVLTVRIAFGKLALTALQDFYAAQYNAVLNSALFLTPYRLVCAAFMQFKVRTFHILAGESVFRHRGAAVYDEVDVATSGTRLSQAKKRLSDAIEGGNRNEIQAAQAAAAVAIRECMAALDKFKLAGNRSASFRQSGPL